MAVKKESTETNTFTKEQLLGSEKYADRRDLICALLADDEAYTFEEVEQKITAYTEGGID